MNSVRWVYGRFLSGTKLKRPKRKLSSAKEMRWDETAFGVKQRQAIRAIASITHYSMTHAARHGFTPNVVSSHLPSCVLRFFIKVSEKTSFQNFRSSCLGCRHPNVRLPGMENPKRLHVKFFSSFGNGQKLVHPIRKQHQRQTIEALEAFISFPPGCR